MIVSSWVNIAVPLATLVLGWALNTANQAVANRRQERRDQRSSKDRFYNDNFRALQRDEMLQMQEVVHDCFGAVSSEMTRRRDTEYQILESKRLAKLKVLDVPARAKTLEAMMTGFREDGFPSEKRDEIVYRLFNGLASYTEAMDELTRTVNCFAEQIAKRLPFMGDLSELIHGMQLHASRSGSPTVERCTGQYIKAIMKWDTYFTVKGAAEPFAEVRKARYELDRALATALAYGPYEQRQEADQPISTSR
jgi:hypothetical protein